jgi:uncharacterized integral membrane protein
MPVPDESDREPGGTGPEPPAGTAEGREVREGRETWEAPEARQTRQAPEGGVAPEGSDGRPAPGRPRPSLAGDLAEVQRGRPERAFDLGLVLGILLTLAVAIFVVQNNQSTHFDWLWFDFQLPLWTALLGAMAFGALMIVVGFAVHERRQRRLGRRQDAAGRLRRALGPEGEPVPAERRSRGGFLRRGRPRASNP